ncbi:hypothetical protein AMATHDRAFT_46730 [Amanita thiersii Skay4041]|uniref:J domain-containing protein n=1 Tax=Amanita thiersii Skay4041 TaxID=703135 RepID=A0A2A9NUH8_9AGAR|nr:hypothetical protein AMATHDRAFT_46730 [Amanita thiersii Skay4041]
MSTNPSLYDTLELSKDASPEEIRRAYKKKALQTHPDRLPINATEDDKKNSEEQFRKVNNAYEILSDAQKRKLYDRFGVWPPPEPDQDYRSGHGPHRSRPYQRHPRGNTYPEPFMPGFSTFVFTDPFALFDEIFGAEFPEWRHRSGYSSFAHEDPFFSPFHDPFHRMPMGVSGLMARMERELFGMPSPFSTRAMIPPSHPFLSLEQPYRDRRGRNSGRFTQESYMTQTINGVTQSVHRRIDMDGNEHVTRSYPDGHEVYTINGLEQPVRGYLPSGSGGNKDARHESRHESRREQRHLPSSHVDGRHFAPAQLPQPISVARSEYSSPPPPYPDHESNAYNPRGCYADNVACNINISLQRMEMVDIGIEGTLNVNMLSPVS